jgi:hypothetical protein
MNMSHSSEHPKLETDESAAHRTAKSSNSNSRFAHSVTHRFAGMSGSVDSHTRAIICRLLLGAGWALNLDLILI